MTENDERESTAEPVEEQVDEINQNILEAVIENPRITVQGIMRQLADKQIKLSESSIQKRFSGLLTQKRLERMIVVRDWAASGYPLRYRIDIKANIQELLLGNGGPPNEGIKIDSQKKLCGYIKDNLAREYRYRGRLVVLDAMILLGHKEADISVTVRVKDPKTILEFVTEGLQILRGVKETVASHEAWTYGESE
jgi:DNA-binding Lrp family transcriptional regulator